MVPNFIYSQSEPSAIFRFTGKPIQQQNELKESDAVHVNNTQKEDSNLNAITHNIHLNYKYMITK